MQSYLNIFTKPMGHILPIFFVLFVLGLIIMFVYQYMNRKKPEKK